MSSAPAGGSRASPARSGLREAHAHIGALGESLELGDLAACTSVHECLDAIRLAAEQTRRMPGHAARWVRMKGARIEAWAEHRWPTVTELDRATGDLPCVIKSLDHHAAAANSAGLAGAGLRAGDTVPPSGVVCVDERGDATGLLLEHAAYRVWDAAPQPTPQERLSQVRQALKTLAALGFAEVHDMLSEDWLAPILLELERHGELPVESVWLYFPYRAPWRAWNFESRRVRWRGYKVFLDGTINSRTALMLHDYVDPMPGLARGRAMISPQALESAIRAAAEAAQAGMPSHLAVHAIGDAAVRMALDTVERVGPKFDHGVPLRVEHAQVIDEEDVPRFAKLGVVCSMQPCHLLTDIEAMTRHFPHRLDRVMPLRELIDSGCRPGELLWLGSDVPVVRADPEDSVSAATLRRRPEMPQSQAIAWEQRISAKEVWAGFRPPTGEERR